MEDVMSIISRMNKRSVALTGLAAAMVSALLVSCGGSSTPETSGSTSAGSTTETSTSESSQEPTTELSTSAAALSKDSLVFGYVPAIDIWTAFVAKDMGYFDDEGLDVELKSISGGADLLSALIGGSIDVGTSGATSVWKGIKEGAPLKSFLAAEIGNIGQLAISAEWAKSHNITQESTPAEKIEALRGALVATNLEGGSLNAWAVQFLTASGLQPGTDLTIQTLDGGAAMLAAFEAGRVDAFVHIPPVTSQAKARDNAILMDLNDVPALPAFKIAPSDLYTAQIELIEKHPDTISAMSRAIVRAYDYIMKNRDDATVILENYLGEVGPGFTDLDFGNLESQGLILTEDGVKAGIEINSRILGDDFDVTLEDVYDPTFGKDALAAVKDAS
jgi:NitT/TauT family transport system substrate-binding protein